MWAEPDAPPKSESRRQGYCGYCRVLYSNLDQHLSSPRHLELVRASSPGNRTKGDLLERFLQDVIKYHPHHYKDPRPSYADLPPGSTPLVPHRQVEEVGADRVSEDVGLSDDRMASSDSVSHPHGDPQRLSQSGEGVGEETRSAPVFEQEDKSSAPLTLTTPFHSQVPPPTHRKAHRKSNRRKTSQTSSDLPESESRTHAKQGQDQELGPLQDSGPCAALGSRDVPAPSSTPGPRAVPPQSSSPGLVAGPGLSSGPGLSVSPGPSPDPGPSPGLDPGPGPGSGPKAVPGLSSGPVPGPSEPQPWLAWQKERRAAYKDQSFCEQVNPLEPLEPVNQVKPMNLIDQMDLMDQMDQVDQVDQVVIQTKCHGDDQEETDSFILNLPFFLKTVNQDCDAPAQAAGPASQRGDLNWLRSSQVDVRDQVYSAQLDSALKTKEEGLQRVGLPDSFQGKTLEQLEREDDERIKTLVQQFRTQNFICYFDSESLARYGRRGYSKKRCPSPKGEKTDSGVMPLLDVEEEGCLSEKRSPAMQWRSKKRRFRLASRCQVVKVSHGTQTVPLVVPRPVAETPSTTALPTKQEFPLCSGPAPPPWLRLPPPYANLVSPVQPRTSVVYLLTPPSGPATSKTSASDHSLRHCKRKRRPLEATGALTVRYKRLPLRVYQPRTNRILRTARKGSVPSGSHVRQLFRSLNPDLNRPLELRSTISTEPDTQGVEST